MNPSGKIAKKSRKNPPTACPLPPQFKGRVYNSVSCSLRNKETQAAAYNTRSGNVLYGYDLFCCSSHAVRFSGATENRRRSSQ